MGACELAWLPSPASVTLAATDSGGSGVAHTVYTTDGTDPDATSTARHGTDHGHHGRRAPLPLV